MVDLDTVGERTREKGELGWGKNDKEPLALALPLAAFLSLHFLFFTQSLFFSHARDLSRPRPSSLHIVISFHPYIILSESHPVFLSISLHSKYLTFSRHIHV